MALQRTHSLPLFLVLTLLGLGLIQPSYGQNYMYQRFLRQHVDTQGAGGSGGYCNVMMQRRKMTTPRCKPVNSFIHESIWDIHRICNNPNIQCKNGNTNCHEGTVRVTDCRVTGASTSPNCRYQGMARTRRVVIACDVYLNIPVHFDG